MAGPIVRGAFSALLAPDLRRFYVETGKERPQEYPLWCNVDTMEWSPQTDRQISSLGIMPDKPEGTTFVQDQPILGGTKTYDPGPRGMAVEITWEMWRDDLYGVMRELSKGLARASRNRLEVDAHKVLNRAFSTSYVGFTSGEALCSTSHARLDGGTAQANRPSPDVGFSVSGVQNMILSFEGGVDERGMPRLLSPVMVMVTPTKKFAAREILGSSGKPYSADNEINALVEEDLSWFVSHYLDTATYWFGLAAKGNHDMRMGVRDTPIFDSFDDPWTKNAIFTVYQRNTESTFGAYRGVYGSTG